MPALRRGSIGFEDRRRTGRAACRTSAAFRLRHQRRFDVEIVNLSTHGCAVRSASGQVAGAQGWITFPTLAGWDANVAWCDGSSFGLEFARPLHAAVADLIILRSSRNLLWQARNGSRVASPVP